MSQPSTPAQRAHDRRPAVGVDVGGAESGVADLDEAYRHAGRWLEDRLKTIDTHRS